jgi:hypothetical protein
MCNIHYYRGLLILVCLCVLLLLSACGGSGSSVIMPNVNTGEQIAQPTPSVSPFPVHHSSAPDTAP